MSAIIQHAIENYQSLFLYGNARFLAERLYYDAPSEEHRHVLAKCYYAQGKIKQAYLILQGGTTTATTTALPANRYLYAMACVALGKLEEVEAALCPRDRLSTAAVTKEAILEAAVPGGAAGIYLLGHVARRQHRKEVAVTYFQTCLVVDPLMWCAAAELCEMGIPIDLESTFGLNIDAAVGFLNNESDSDNTSDGHHNSTRVAKAVAKLHEDLHGGPHNTHFLSQLAKNSYIEALSGHGHSAMDNHDMAAPRYSAQLGRSSSAQRVPFASPSSMPQSASFDRSLLHRSVDPLRESDLFMSRSMSNTQVTGIHSHQMHSGNNNPNHSTNNLHHYDATAAADSSSYSTSNVSHGNAIDLRRSRLFDMSSPEPSSTPEYSSHTNNHTGTHTSNGRPAYLAAGLGAHYSTFSDASSAFSHGGNSAMRPPRFAGFTGSGQPQPHRSALASNSLSESRIGSDSFGAMDADADADSGSLHQHHLLTAPNADLSSAFNAITPIATPVNATATMTTGIAILNQSQTATAGLSTVRRQLASAVHIDSHSHSQPHTGNRRVSFGPTARQSFSNLNVPVAATVSSNDPGIQTHADRARGSDRRGVDLFGVAVADMTPVNANTNDIAAVTVTNSHTPLLGQSQSLGTNVPHAANSSIDEFGLQHVSPIALRMTPLGTGESDVGADVNLDVEPSSKMSKANHNTNVNNGAANNAYNTDIDINTNTNTTSNIDIDSGRWAMAMLCTFVGAQQHLSHYRMSACIALLHRLPTRHFRSGAAQQMVGRAYFELNDYSACVLAFKEMLRLEPFRLQGVDCLSTALWHLKRSTDLCALAQRCIDVDRFAPEAWCVVGNSFSLQRETDAALRFFHRALQLDPHYTYAHTLSGHECVNNEDFDKAAQCFRQALRCDERHYNAWYGLAAIYYRQERYDLAELHFRRALAINPHSSVLSCYLSMVLHAQASQLMQQQQQQGVEEEDDLEGMASAKIMEALDTLEAALENDPKNSQLHFQRSHILTSVDRLEEALEELLVVRSLAPREPPVYGMLGRVCQRLGRSGEAVQYFMQAIDLDPKEGVNLKAELESIEDPDLDSIMELIQQ